MVDEFVTQISVSCVILTLLFINAQSNNKIYAPFFTFTFWFTCQNILNATRVQEVT